MESDAKRGARVRGKRTKHFYDLKEDKLSYSATFFIEGVDLCVINSARRAVISDVKNVAVDFDPSNPVPFDIKNPLTSGIFFKKNTSVTDNEKLGRLISLIPICVDENRIKGYHPNIFKFIIKAKNNGEEILSIKSSDIRVLDPADSEVSKAVRDSMFPACPITNDHILIVRLKPSPLPSQEGEEIDIEFRARLGSGRENACWSPVCKCAFGFVRNDELFERNLAALIENLRLEYEQGGKTFTREDYERERNQYATLDGQRNFSIDENDNPVAIQFNIESVNRLRPTYLFREGLSVLSQKMKDFMDGIKDYDEEGWGAENENDVDAAFEAPSRIKIVKQANMDDMFEIAVNDEGHTLGNLVQGLLYRHWNMNSRSQEGGAKGVVFIGYTEPHPPGTGASSSDDRIVFYIKVNPGDRLGKVMEEGLSWCIDYVESIKNEFAEFAGLS